MKILLSLLEQMINLEKYSIETTIDMLTNLGFEVNFIEKIKDVDFYKDLVVGEIISCKKHPNADRLNITTVNVGDGNNLTIICGAPNAREGIKVVVAKDNTKLTTFNGEQVIIKKTKIRGEVSEGMLCAEDEIGLSPDHEKIIELDKNLTPGTTIDKIFNIKSDYVLDIELVPNRWYAASHIGVARDIAAKISYIENKNVSLTTRNTHEIDNLPKLKDLKVNLLDSNICRRYCGLLCRNIQIKPSSENFQRTIKSLGIQPINNIVDITNFVMFLTGQPLHAYDFNKISGDINVKLSTGVAIKALNNETYDTKNDIVVCDDDKILCLAGVIGCHFSAISATTTDVFFESADFNSAYIYRTAKRLNIQTEASKRFGHGVGYSDQMLALQYIYDLLKQEDVSFVGTIDVNTITSQQVKISSSFTNINSFIGEKISHEKIKNILSALGIQTDFIDTDKFIATIPYYRNNIQCEADIVEEILRIYGYENLNDKNCFSFVCKTNDNLCTIKNQIEQQISVALSAKGFYEIKTNSLVTSKTYADGPVKLLNPSSNNAEMLRQDMLLSELGVISDNISHGNKNLKFFEIGKTYKQTTDGIQETQHLSILTFGVVNDAWNCEKEDIDMIYIKSIVLDIFTMFNITNLAYKGTTTNDFIIEYENKTLATIGKVNNEILLQNNISQEVFWGDIDLDLLFDIVQNKKCVEYKAINNLPVVKRDLSLILDKNIKFSDVEKIIKTLHEKNIIDFKLFSVFENNANKKTYSLSFYLQDNKKNLEADVIQKIMDRLMQAFISQIGAEIKQ